MAVIRGKSCFEKNAFEDTENPHPPTKTRLPVKEYLGKYSRYRKKICFILKLFLRPIIFHGKLSFDNLTYFKLYGNLNTISRRDVEALGKLAYLKNLNLKGNPLCSLEGYKDKVCVLI